ncbi:hypothetical protein TNCV_1489251 [Trichonephila clavipes]|nr:hypothetical protein TNCV_1489251 [Trichonephila clavipes]
MRNCFTNNFSSLLDNKCASLLRTGSKTLSPVDVSDMPSAVSEWILTSAMFSNTRSAVVAQCQGIGSWQACHEFESSTTKDPPCRAAMRVKSVES